MIRKLPVKIGLLSPNYAAYTETFIQNHKENLKGEVFYYYGNKYGNRIPVFLENGEHVMLPLFTKKFPAKVLSKLFPFLLRYFQLKGLKRSFVKHGIAAVFCEYGITGADVTPVCKALNIPLIVQFHGYDATVKQVLRKYETRYRNMFRYAAAILVVSTPMKNKLVGLGAPESKIIVNINGAPDTFSDILPCANSQQLLSVGRFVEKKAPHNTILAFAKVYQKFSGINLVMCGDGPLLEKCKELVRKLNLEHAINFPGKTSPDKVRSLMAGSFAYIQHSVTAANGDTEGSPVSVIEASAAGLPVVSTLHAGIPEVIINGSTGILVEEQDVDGMAEAIITLLKNRELARQMGQAGKQNISANFSLRKHNQTMNEIVQQAITASKHHFHTLIRLQ